MWSDFVNDVKVDETLTAFPKITTAAATAPIEPTRPNKRKAVAKYGPAIRTPISAIIKRKEPKQAKEDKSNNEQATEDNIEVVNKAPKHPSHPRHPQINHDTGNERQNMARQPHVRVFEDSQPADMNSSITNKKTQRERSTTAAGNKENLAPC